MCALALGPSGGHGCSERAARPLSAGPARTDRWTRRGSVYLPTRWPLWASSAGFELRLLRLSRCNEARGWAFFFFFFLLSRLRVCVCAQNISLEKDGRWRPEGSPQGGSGGGRQAAPGCRRSCHPSAVPAFIKEKGECKRWVETAFPLLASSQRREGAGAKEGPQAKDCCLRVSDSHPAPLTVNLAPYQELKVDRGPTPQHSV